MKKNVGGIDKYLRLVAGIALIALAALGEIGVWGYLVGAIVLATSIFNFCSLYLLLGVNTCKMKGK